MICGIDEAGRGPVIGPLVIACVCVENDDGFVRLGVKDSKKHSPRRREELAKKIYKMGSCAVRVITADDIDALRSQMTLNVIEANGFSSLVNEICEEGCTVYVDSASANEDKFADMIRSNLNKGIKSVKIVSEHGADDRYPVVSAASVCAKVKRDEEVEKISKELGEDIGSGYPSDPNTRRFLKNWVKEHGELPPHTRASWQTSKDVLNQYSNKKLDDF